MPGPPLPPDPSPTPSHTIWPWRAFRYTNLGDVCFRLANANDGGYDYYWLSRDSALLIRGGANYAYEQINAELVRVYWNPPRRLWLRPRRHTSAHEPVAPVQLPCSQQEFVCSAFGVAKEQVEVRVTGMLLPLVHIPW